MLNQEAYKTGQIINNNTPYVECEIQIIMINDRNRVKDISKILHHPFFKNIRGN